MGVKAAISRFANAVLRRPLIATALLAFTMAAGWFGVSYPLGPGQDAHYHFFNAVVVSKLWTGDAYYRALYETVNPLDSNTLLYTFLFPFELALPPLTAWRVGFTLYYLVGYPLACALALHLLRRPMWGALLAFPLAYAVKTFSQGGYLPFVSVAPLMVLAIALMHRINEGTSTRRMQIACSVIVALAFIGHAHAYAWMMFLLATGTIVAMLLALVPGLLQTPLRALLRALFIGLRALLVVLPSLLLFGAWWMRTHHGSHADAGWSLRPTMAPMSAKVTSLWALLVAVPGDRELEFLLGLGIVVFACLALGRRRRETGVPTPELAVVLTFVSWWLLPADVSGQMVADRHMDLLVWLLPLAIYAGEPEGGRLRHALAVGSLVVYAWMRLAFYGEAMRHLQGEYAGMVTLAKTCPTPRGELAYVTSTATNAHWYGKGLHQTHETFAALCALDTPVYDRVYPHNLLPLRYKSDLPVPITIGVGGANHFWTASPALERFDYVLVQGWQPTPAEIAGVPAAWKLEGQSRGWSLWRRAR